MAVLVEVVAGPEVYRRRRSIVVGSWRKMRQRKWLSPQRGRQLGLKVGASRREHKGGPFLQRCRRRRARVEAVDDEETLERGRRGGAERGHMRGGREMGEGLLWGVHARDNDDSPRGAAATDSNRRRRLSVR
jgi:hypothetical protein